MAPAPTGTVLPPPPLNGAAPGAYGASTSANPFASWFPGAGNPPFQRLFQDTGARYTWLAGDSGEELGLNEIEITSSLVFQNFARSDHGLRVSPGFIFDFTSGPSPPPATVTADVPAQLYSAYLDSSWDPRFGQRFGADLDFRIGVYSDFKTATTDTIRLTGTGVGLMQINPTMTLKLGATYLDRVDLKLLPAFGVLWEPDARSRWDLFFPSPKISKYFTTMGNADLWWYVGGEYGGSSWSIERTDHPEKGRSDRLDINDIRVFGGVDWHGLNLRHGFLELGYGFERELVSYLVPAENLSLDETVMIRAGFFF